MTPARIFMYLVYTALIVGLVVVGAAAYTGAPPFGPTLDDGTGVGAEPTLTSFASGGGQCVEAPEDRADTELVGSDAETVMRVSGTIPVPDANYAVDVPELVKEGPGTYRVEITASEETRKAGRNCTGEAEYELTIQIPEDAGRTELVVVHDGEFVASASTGNRTAN